MRTFSQTHPDEQILSETAARLGAFYRAGLLALDMPFMKRYSRSYLIRHPERRGKDVETTRRSCEKFRAHPTTIVNFVEGSQFTEEKHQQTRSPYQHLLPPKAAGIAMALNVLDHSSINS